MRITRADAHKVAKKLLEKKHKELKKLSDDNYNLVQKVAISKVPEKVLAMFKAYPGYFHTTNKLFTLEETYYFTERLPHDNDKCNWAISVAMPKETMKELWNSKNKVDKLDREIKKLHDDIVQTLTNLVSYKRIQEEFPEATPYLPTKMTTALAINVKDIVKRING